MKMIWCGLKIEKNCHVLVNQFHGNFLSKIPSCREIKPVFRDVKLCLNASWRLKGLKGIYLRVTPFWNTKQSSLWANESRPKMQGLTHWSHSHIVREAGPAPPVGIFGRCGEVKEQWEMINCHQEALKGDRTVVYGNGEALKSGGDALKGEKRDVKLKKIFA